MEETCAAVECVSSCPMGKDVQGVVAILHPGVDALAMILDDVVLQSDAGGGAAVAAGLFQGTEADNGLSPETRNAKDLSHGQGVVPGLTRENEDLRLWFICRILLWLGDIQIFIVMLFLFFRVGQVTYCVMAVCLTKDLSLFLLKQILSSPACLKWNTGVSFTLPTCFLNY